MNKVMVFGTFDGVHDGHLHLFREAAEYGSELIVVVARDEHVLELKGQRPMRPMEERMELVGYESEVTHVIEGDEELGSYDVIRAHEPSTIVLGYDQDELRNSLETWVEDEGYTVQFSQASAYMPDVFKSSYLNAEIGEGVGAL